MIGGHELTALIHLRHGQPVETGWISRACGSDGEWARVATARTRRMLQRMARKGLVTGVRMRMCGPVVAWRITTAGREALAASDTS